MVVSASASHEPMLLTRHDCSPDDRRFRVRNVTGTVDPSFNPRKQRRISLSRVACFARFNGWSGIQKPCFAS